VAAEPTANVVDLTKASTSLAASLLVAGRPEALSVARESVARWRALVKVEPTAYGADLAKALSHLAGILMAAGKWRKALPVGGESVVRWRELAAVEPTAHTANLAKALANLAAMMCNTGDHDDELELRAEAVARLARLAYRRPDEAEDHYHRERSEFAQQCSQHNRDPGFAIRAELRALHALAGEIVAQDGGGRPLS
jgi:hypothetical protein